MSEEEDSFLISTVPRHSVFGKEDDTESTLGDRFFDLMHLQTNSAKKSDLGRWKAKRDGTSSNAEETSENCTATTNDISSEKMHQDVPFELNRLAMFRPPSRTRSSGRRSNTIPREENTTRSSARTVEVSGVGNLRSSGGCTNKQPLARLSSNSFKSGLKPSVKTVHRSISRPMDPTQVRQRSLSKEKRRAVSVEVKPKMGPTTRQQAVRIRATNDKPWMRESAEVNTVRTNGSLVRETKNSGAHVPPRGPFRVCPVSTDASALKVGAVKAGLAISDASTTVQRRSGTNLTVPAATNARTMISGAAVKKTSPYWGPETRARARMKQSSQTGGTRELVSSDSTVSTPKRGIQARPVHLRPLSQLNPNLLAKPEKIPRNAAMPASSDKVVGGGHISRPRIRTTNGPIRVQNASGTVKQNDGLPPVGSESRFRQSVTRRPKGGDSTERDMTRENEKENGSVEKEENARSEACSVTARKSTPVLQFAPCLRNSAAAKKVSSAIAANTTKPSSMGHASGSKGDASRTRRRRTEAEREAFFRRLSTPKTVANIKKCTK